MLIIKKFKYSIFVLAVLFFGSCRRDKYEPVQSSVSGYPDEVDAIITNKCATAGCHNSASAATSANLDFSTYDKMLNGNNLGAVVIPYSPNQSTLLFFTNTDSLLGPKLAPTMPVNETPLSKQEYLTLKNWISIGAPYKNGTVPFSGDPNRRKFYVVNQGCDLLSVFDVNKRVIMRYKDLGTRPGLQDGPHNIKITPDGKYALIPFLAENLVQEFSTETDELVANIQIPIPDSGAWNTIVISSDSKWAYSVDNAQGRIAYIDLLSNTATVIYTNTPQLHGIALNATNDTMLVVENLGYHLWVIPVNSPTDYDQRDLRNDTTVNGHDTTGTGNLNMHEIVFSPDFSEYFITAEGTNKVYAYKKRANNPNRDSLVAVFKVPEQPQEIAFSKSTDYVFITCMSATTFPGVTGAVEVINYKTLQHVATLQAGWQPHGIAVDDNKGLVYVVNRNATPNGPAPHHATCGRDGWLTTFDLHTLQKLPGDPELSGDPYQAAVRP